MSIIDCPHCGTRVAITREGTCPSCRGQVDDAPVNDESRPQQQLHSAVESHLHKLAKPPAEDELRPQSMIGTRGNVRLTLLSVSHYGFAVLLLGSSLLLLAIAAFGLWMALDPSSFQPDGATVTITETRGAGIFTIVAASLLAIAHCVGSIGNFRAVRALANNRKYHFCRRMGWWNRIFVPIGTILGIATLLRLSSHDIKQSFSHDIAVRSYGHRRFSFGAVAAGVLSSIVVTQAGTGLTFFLQSKAAIGQHEPTFASQEDVNVLATMFGMWFGGMVGAATANNLRFHCSLGTVPK